MSDRARYKVMVDDNSHYMDGDERYEAGQFDTAEAAVAAARKIVDDSLADLLREKPDSSAAELYERYKAFGEDPFVASPGPEPVAFSAWKYAETRCREIAAASSPAAGAAGNGGLRTAIVKALVFSAALTATSVVFDTLYTWLIQGIPLGGRPRQFVVFRTALFGASFVIAAIGALAGFWLARDYTIPNALVALLGAASSLLALVAVVAAVQAGGFLVIAICLFAGSAAIAFAGGKLLGDSPTESP